MRSETPGDAGCSCFIPACYRDIFPSEGDALRATFLDPALLARMQVQPLVGGGRLFQEMHIAFIIVPARSGGVELWTSGPGLFCPTRAEAEAAVREYESAPQTDHDEGNWRVFALA